MSLYTPLPGDGAVPIHATGRLELQPGEKGTVEVRPDNQQSTHYVPTVAISKHPDATYGIKVDETWRFGPHAAAPPTDVDDLEVTFYRALEMENSVEVVVRDVRTTGATREYEMHVIGYEVGQ